MLNAVDLSLIVVGSALVLLIIGVSCYCLRRDRRRAGAEGEQAYLIIDSASPSVQGGDLATIGPGTEEFGDLDPAGVARIWRWLHDVKAAQQQHGLDPIPEQIMIERLGHVEDLGPAPVVYSPRVSNIGSDDGRGTRERNYDDAPRPALRR